MDRVDEFILAYSNEKLGWSETNPIFAARRMCEEYFYNPKLQYSGGRKPLGIIS
jgi:hypothetical protein